MNKTKVIVQFINSYVNDKKFDQRIFSPPPPPELRDSIKHRGITKPDSIISGLGSLMVYVGENIEYDSIFQPKTKPLEGFEFVSDLEHSTFESIQLDLSVLPDKVGIIIKGIEKSEFNKLYDTIRLKNDYGGFVSFKNLHHSDTELKAYFEVTYFKNKLNSATYAIYANFLNNKWVFQTELLFIS